MTAKLLDSPVPIAAAPMAGGPTTVALAAAVASVGAFPFLAGGYRTPHALASEINRVRDLGVPFGVNLFVPCRHKVDKEAFAAYATELEPEAEVYDLHLDHSPITDDDRWDEKFALLTTRPVPVVSLTFGLPSPSDITTLQDVGTRVLATVTTVAEASRAEEAGVDGLVVQGPDAGGHSATFDPAHTPEPIGTADLVRRVRKHADLPVIAAGGVDGPDAVHRLLSAGAQAVAVGTLLLRTDEAGTSAAHKGALADPQYDDTVITRAFTGRPARALRNGFIDRHQDTGLTGYPAVHHLTRALRKAATEAGDTDRMHLWAGTGYRDAPTGPAADVIRWLSPS
ncbi:nitroalkane oxidase [Stackebrandtia endophytica]|uniref:Propionate 3-nitronate monooxygenase n=1 Tax=Stackebrandtia endophytica TaxID=1496996 RepID=A0A543AW26_9ACTN|nr:nitronate monooxygenase [Stackebrandtia endophytica]TQL76751.1 nitroalkane oxidase [Stackebrandtia endophytica]